MSTIDVNVTLKGRFFEQKITPVIERAIVQEVFVEAEARTKRQGRGLGAQRNTISHQRDGLQLAIATTLKRPRTTGRAYQRKQIAALRALIPRKARKVAQRIVEGT